MFSTQRDISHSALVIPLSTQWIGEKMKRLLLPVVLLLMLGSISAQTYQPNWESVDNEPHPHGSVMPSSASLFIGGHIRFLPTRQCYRESWPTLSGIGMR